MKNHQLTNRVQEKVLRNIQQTPNRTNKEIAVALSIKEGSVQTATKKLMDEKLIEGRLERRGTSSVMRFRATPTEALAIARGPWVAA